MTFCAKVWNVAPKYEILYPGMKFWAQVWNVVPEYETLYSGMKFSIQVWIVFVPDYENLIHN
jgi:hypothetical protein